MNKVTIGCDPEFFLKDTKTGAYTSAHDMVPGDKKNPYKLKDGAVQVDGTAVEFNINPASSEEEFVHNIDSVLTQIREMIDKRFEFAFIPAIYYPKAYFDSLPDYTKVLGCDPDYDGYNGREIKRYPDNYPGLRTGSGHIHIGWGKDLDTTDPDHFADCKFFSHWFSYFYDRQREVFDTDKLRGNLYGTKQPFRPKPYGVECRAPSNAWLRDKHNWKCMYNLAVKTDDQLKNGRDNWSIPRMDFRKA